MLLCCECRFLPELKWILNQKYGYLALCCFDLSILFFPQCPLTIKLYGSKMEKPCTFPQQSAAGRSVRQMCFELNAKVSTLVHSA